MPMEQTKKAGCAKRQPAFQDLAPHRGHISNFLPCAFPRGQGGFRKHCENTDILSLYLQFGKADAQNFGLDGKNRPVSDARLNIDIRITSE